MLFLFSPVGRILTGVLVCVACFGWGWLKGNASGAAEIQQAWDREKAVALVEYAKRQADARKKQEELQDRADRIREEKNREIADLTRKHAAALERLRHRPERPASSSGVPQIAGNRPGARGCTPSELYRGDAELALQIAERADQVRLHLAACQAVYQSALKAQ